MLHTALNTTVCVNWVFVVIWGWFHRKGVPHTHDIHTSGWVTSNRYSTVYSSPQDTVHAHRILCTCMADGIRTHLSYKILHPGDMSSTDKKK
jgi:hypothetical protein